MNVVKDPPPDLEEVLDGFPPELSSPPKGWSWGYELGNMAIVLLGGAVMARLGGMPLTHPAMIAAGLAQAVTLAFGRKIGESGRYLPGMLLFVGAAALTEAREGRGYETWALVPTLVILALVRVWLSYSWSHGIDRPVPPAQRSAWAWTVPLALPFLLTLLGLYSAASGGADRMTPWFGWLSPEAMSTTVLLVRKAIHSTFYPLLALAILPALGRHRPDARANIPWALALTAVFAGFDEIRQSAIPGRTGSAWDVLLDLTATTVVLAIVSWRLRRKAEDRL